jgi:RNA polymerase primary sigma factor
MAKRNNFKFQKLSLKEEKELIKRAKEGDKEAINRLYKQYEYYIHALLRKYKSFIKDYNDAYNAAVTGFMKAIKLFDLNKNVRFITYATWWIKDELIEELKQQAMNGIAVNTNLFVQYLKALRIYGMKSNENVEYFVTSEDVMDELNRNNKMRMKSNKSFPRFDAKDLNAFLNISRKVYSLDEYKYNDDEEDITFLDSIIDENVDVEEDIIREEFSKILKDIIETELDERERYIILHKFGLFGAEKKMVKDIARELNFSKEYVNTLYKRALAKIRKAMITKYPEFIESFNIVRR